MADLKLKVSYFGYGIRYELGNPAVEVLLRASARARWKYRHRMDRVIRRAFGPAPLDYSTHRGIAPRLP